MDWSFLWRVIQGFFSLSTQLSGPSLIPEPRHVVVNTLFELNMVLCTLCTLTFWLTMRLIVLLWAEWGVFSSCSILNLSWIYCSSSRHIHFTCIILLLLLFLSNLWHKNFLRDSNNCILSYWLMLLYYYKTVSKYTICLLYSWEKHFFSYSSTHIAKDHPITEELVVDVRHR